MTSLTLGRVVPTNISYPPYTWYDFCKKEQNGLIGHMIQRIAEELNISLSLYHIPMPEDSIASYVENVNVDALKNKKADIIIVTGNSRRDPRLYVGRTPLIVSRTGILMRETMPFIYRMSQLINYKGLVSKYSSVKDYSTRVGVKLNVDVGGSYREMFNELNRGVVDYIILDYYTAGLLIESSQQSYQLFDMNLTIEELYLASRVNDPARYFVDRFDEMLDRFHSDKFVDYLQKVYLKVWLKERHCAIINSPERL